MADNNQLQQALFTAFIGKFTRFFGRHTGEVTITNYSLDGFQQLNDTQYEIILSLPTITKAKVDIPLSEDVINKVDSKALYASVEKNGNILSAQCELNMKNWVKIILTCADADSPVTIDFVDSSFAHGNTVYAIQLSSANISARAHREFDDKEKVNFALIEKQLMKAYDEHFANILSLDKLQKGIKFSQYDVAANILLPADMKVIKSLLNNEVVANNYTVIGALGSALMAYEKVQVSKGNKKGEVEEGKVVIKDIQDRLCDIISEYVPYRDLNIIDKISRLRNIDARKSIQSFMPGMIGEVDSNMYELRQVISTYHDTMIAAPEADLQELHVIAIKHWYTKAKTTYQMMLKIENLLKIIANN